MNPNLDVVPAFRLAMSVAAERVVERAAVVAWLRAEMDYMLSNDLTGGPMHIQGLIESIERGEHRREEER